MPQLYLASNSPRRREILQNLGYTIHNIAAEMLRGLSGDTHQVLTAVCVSFGAHEHAAVQQNTVQFCPLGDAQIAAYIATGEPLDKAGAYGIQGIGGVFVQHLAGSFTGVMGLPVFETIALLQRCGAAVPPFQAAAASLHPAHKESP